MSEFLDDISQAGGQTVNYWKGTWVYNATVNRPVIARGRKSGRVHDMGKHPRVTRAPAYIVCSGPSLDDTPWDRLRSLQLTEGAGVFAATSNVGVCLANGLTPQYVTVVDANHTIHDQVKGLMDLLGDVELFTSPIADPDLVREWPGPVWVFKPLQHGDDFTMSTLPAMYSDMHELDATHRVLIDWFTTQFLNAGCVTNAMLLAAAYLGYDPIFLLGNDLGFPHLDPDPPWLGRMRATTYTRTGGVFTPEATPPLTTKELLRTANNGVRTISEYLHYKLNLFIAWRLTPCMLFNTSFRGILHPDEIPMVTVADAIDKWKDIVYPIKPGSSLWHKHVQAITERMGMRMVTIPNGYQITPISEDSIGVVAPPKGRRHKVKAGALTVPSTGVVSTGTPRLESNPHA